MKLKFILILIFTTLTFISFAQKRKVIIKKDLVSLNDFPQFVLEESKYDDNYELYSLKNEKLAVFKRQTYVDPKLVSDANKYGRVYYLEIIFLNENMDKCEVRLITSRKELAEIIIHEGLVKDDKLNETAVKQFCHINGMKYSEDRKSTGSTIIIKH